MKFGKTASRSTEEIVDEFGQLVEEGKALLGEFVKRPLPKSTAMRDTLDAFNEKLADYQASATRVCPARRKAGNEICPPGRSSTCTTIRGPSCRRNRARHPCLAVVEPAPLSVAQPV